MPHALLPAGLFSQDRQGGTARFIRRLGGAVRGALTRLRRPAPPPATPPDRPAKCPQTPPRAPRRPRTAPATWPGWLARCWLRLSRRPAAASHRRLEPGDEPFTPETHPHYSPEVCELLNTPVGECDPVLLRGVFQVFAQCIAEQLPPELGLNNPDALFATLWGELAEALAQDPADAVPVEAPAEPPSTGSDAAPDAPPPSRHTRRNAPASGAPRGTPPATSTAPDIPVLPEPDRRRRPAHRQTRRRFPPPRRAMLGRGRHKSRHGLPPRPHAYYACAGPP